MQNCQIMNINKVQSIFQTKYMSVVPVSVRPILNWAKN